MSEDVCGKGSSIIKPFGKSKSEDMVRSCASIVIKVIKVKECWLLNKRYQVSTFFLSTGAAAFVGAETESHLDAHFIDCRLTVMYYGHLHWSTNARNHFKVIIVTHVALVCLCMYRGNIYVKTFCLKLYLLLYFICWAYGFARLQCRTITSSSFQGICITSSLDQLFCVLMTLIILQEWECQDQKDLFVFCVSDL